MDSENVGAQYKIFGADHQVYGPVELPTLVDWIKDERVTAETWIFLLEKNEWKKAAQMAEVKMFFQKKAAAAASMPAASGLNIAGVKPGTLRRVKVFADFSDEQLEKFVALLEVQQVRQWAEIVRQGDTGDAMYLILEGELRVRLMVSGKETILATLQAGEFFGEISLFDSGPRSADVVANKDSLVLRITATAFGNMVANAPELAAPFLFAIGKTLTARIRADNKRYRDSIAFARSAGLGRAGASPG
jgi:hypothetical protein